MEIDTRTISNDLTPQEISRAGSEFFKASQRDDYEKVSKNLFEEVFPTLSEEERNLIYQAYSQYYQEGDSSLHRKLTRIDYEHDMVGVDEWLNNPYYTGSLGKELWDFWKGELSYICHPDSGIYEWYVCVSGDTPVALCDGSTPTIEELAATKKTGETFWVWSYDRQKKRVVPAKAKNPRKTRRRQVCTVWLDNGTYFRATPDHPVLRRDGELSEVQDLKAGDSLMPCRRRVTESGSLVGYRQVYQPIEARWEYEHRLVADYLSGSMGVRTEKREDGTGRVVHHKDFDRLNNDPENLELQWADEHLSRHQKAGESTYAKHPWILERLRAGQERWVRSEEGKRMSSERISRWNEENKDILRGRAAEALKCRWEDDEQRRRASAKMRELNEKGVARKGGQAFLDKHPALPYSSVVESFDRGNTTVTAVAEDLGVGTTTVCRAIKREGYEKWSHFKKSRTGNNNHKVVRVEYGEEEDVYCLEVPSTLLWGLVLRTEGGEPDPNDVIISHNTGCIGGGKCVNTCTLVQTDRGVIPAGEVKEGDTVLSESGPRRVAAVWREGVKKSIKVRTHSGCWDENTPHHRHRVWEDGVLVWRRNDELKAGDLLVRKPGDLSLWGDNSSLSEREAEIVGLWVADGHYQGKRAFITTNEVPLVSSLLDAAGSQFSVEYPKDRCPRAVVRGRLSEFIREECETGAALRKVPRSVMEAPKEVVESFLRGYFSGDGGVSGGKVEATSISLILLEQIQTLLWCLGVKSTIRPKSTPSGVPTWRLTISSKQGKFLFLQQVGFLQKYKTDRLREVSSDTGHWRDNDRECIPGAHRAYKEWYLRIPLSLRGKKSLCYSRLKTIFNAGIRGTAVTKKAVRQALEIPEVRYVADPLLSQLVEEDWWLEPVESVEPSECEMVDFTIDGDPSYVANGFISHNTFTTLIAQIYKGPYFCSCLRNPQRFFGIAENSEIVFGLFNANLSNAQKVDFEQATRFIREGEYWAQKCPAGIKVSECSVSWPTRQMRLQVGSSEMHVLGSNLFSFMIDEVNFMKTPALKTGEEHQAYKIYHHATRRLKSRFQKFGVTPGLACVVSSRLATSSFLENLMEDNQGNPGTYVTDVALWDPKPAGTYSPNKFRVAVGNKYRRSEVLDDVDTNGSVNTFDWTVKRDKMKMVPEGMKAIAIPVDFYFDFCRDTDGNLRDIAGVPTHGVSPLIYRSESVLECVDSSREHPFISEEVTLSLDDDDASLIGYMQWKKLCRIVGGSWVLRKYPGEPRFAHVDLGLTGDCAAIAVGCAGQKFTLSQYDPQTGQTTDRFMPTVHVDFMLRIRPVRGQQIDLAKIVNFIVNLKNYGIYLQRCTFDGFASEMAIQAVQKANILPPRTQQKKNVGDELVKVESYVLSVDRTDKQYRLLRDMLFQNAISYYEYKPFIDEVLALEHDVKRTAQGVVLGKVDHPESGSKDCSDAVAGMCWNVATARTGGAQEPVEGMAGDESSPQDIEDSTMASTLHGWRDADRVQAIHPSPGPTTSPRTAKGRKIQTRSDWMSELEGFGRHRSPGLH